MCAEALALLRQQEPWFVSLAILGALYVAAVAYRLLHTSGLALCLRRPKDLRCHYGAWGVVTGPTSGIGRSMALELARRGLNLVLVGRDPATLQDVSETISDAHGVLTKTVQFDFSLVSTPQGEEAMGRLRQAVEGLEMGVLVNNAGVATPHATYLHEAPLYVDTKMVTNMVTRGGLLLQLIMPTSDAYAGAAARWIGHRRPVCMPNLGHRLQWCLCHFVPNRVLAAHRLHENLRQRAVFQRLRSSSGEGTAGRRTLLAAA